MKFYKEIPGLFICCFLLVVPFFKAHSQSLNTKPLRLAVIGATHGHFPWVLEREGKTDVELVGIYEQHLSKSSATECMAT